MRAAQLKVGGIYGRWQGFGLRAPERLVLVELHGKGWITVRRDDGRQERIRTDALRGPFDEVQRDYQERQAHAQHLQAIRLDWEQYRAGQPCPGCARPYGGCRPDLPGLALQVLATGRVSRTLDLTAMDVVEPVRARMVEQLVATGCAERVSGGLVITDYGRGVLAEQDDDEAFKGAHRDCRFRIFGWHRVSGGPPHCGACCPPPPFSPQVLDTVARMVVESMRQQQIEASIERARVDAERAETLKRQRRAAKVEQHVKTIVHDWPELTEEQREQLRALLRPD
jgi:hypothetical protein